MFGIFSERRRAAEAMKKEKHEHAVNQVFQHVTPEEVALAMLNQDKRHNLQNRKDTIEDQTTYTKEVGALLSELIDAGNVREKNPERARTLVADYLRSINPETSEKDIKLFMADSLLRAKSMIENALEEGTIEVE